MTSISGETLWNDLFIKIFSRCFRSTQTFVFQKSQRNVRARFIILSFCWWQYLFCWKSILQQQRKSVERRQFRQQKEEEVLNAHN